MNTYTYVFFIILVIVAVFAFCFIFCFLIKRFLKQKGKTKLKGGFKLFKLFEFNFEAEHDDNKK